MGLFGERERFKLVGEWDWFTKDEFIDVKERYPSAAISVRLQDVTLEDLYKINPKVFLKCDKVEVFFASEFVDLKRFQLICSLPYKLWFYFDDWKHREPIDYNLSLLPANLVGLSSYEDFTDEIKSFRKVKFLAVENIQSLSGHFPTNLHT